MATLPTDAESDGFMAAERQDDETIDGVISGTSGASEAPDKRKAKKIPLGQKLIESGLVSKDQLETALKEQANQGNKRKMIGEILVEMGFITESTLAEILTENTGGAGKRFNIKNAVLDPKLIKQIPKEIAQRCKAVPISVKDGSIILAINDVYNIIAIDQIRGYFPSSLKLVPVYASEADIIEILDQYHGYETSIGGILREIESGIHQEKKKVSGEQEGYVNPTVRLVDAILVDSIKRSASDIHFEPEGSFLRLRYRIDGKLVQIRSFHKEYWPAVAVRLKIMSKMNIAETRKPQDGRTTCTVMGREIDFRVATHPTVHGENIVMRVLDKQKALMAIDALGLMPSNEKLLLKLLKRPEGIIIVTGPTGSGKTTTLYSILGYINSVDVNIMTLENPVEYQLPMLRQSNIHEEKGMDFADGVKSLMRQDPDIIFVGEVRDEATATMAIRAAMTGHKVFTTLHTNDAVGAIPRLVDIGIPPFLLAGSLVCVVAQRLIRRLCLKCRETYTATEEEMRIMGISKPITLHRAKGCESCFGSGYRGRLAVHEILPMSKETDELIVDGASRKALLQAAARAGFVPMAIDGIKKVAAGYSTLDELIRVVDMTERL
jgi:type IV pilus assembly protein PilB